MKSFPLNKNPQALYKLEHIYSDLYQISPDKFNHGQYFIIFVNEFICYVWIYIIFNKLSSIVLEIIKRWLALVQNQSGTKLIKNNVNHPRSKHIDTRHHYIRYAYNSGDVDIRHIPAASQTADILTKPLGTIKHLDSVKLLQLRDSRYV
jgi:hypothetical protein